MVAISATSAFVAAGATASARHRDRTAFLQYARRLPAIGEDVRQTPDTGDARNI